MMVDLRSDTITRPTPAMLEAMMTAPVGDDVFGEDPSVNKLESMAASLFAREAALYCPTGTMSNQVAIKVHTQPGDEVICDHLSHVYQYEGGGIAFNAGAQVRLLQGDRGRLEAAQVAAAINPDDVHKARTSLVSLENTANRAGGSCYDLDAIRAIREVCDQHQLALHLDGARLFNAMVANNESPAAYGEAFHSISICLNKGLGCPIGSILIGDAAFIRKARRVRKVFGGGMRQAGFMAAAGIYALENHVARLATDHAHARRIADALAGASFVDSLLPVETNIVIFGVKGSRTAAEIVAAFKAQDVHAIAISPTQIRFVLHLDVSAAMVEQVIQAIGQVQA